MPIRTLATTVCMTFATATASFAATFTEVGDAGQTAATAQSAVGYDVISGSLIDLGAQEADIDFYEIAIQDTDAFSVSVTASFSVDNDTQLFLFDNAFDLILSDDDGGFDLLSQFNPGELSGSSSGTYYLAVTTYFASAQDGGTISVDPIPFQTGNYSLTVTGISAVPLPAGGVLLLSGLGGIAALKRRKKKAA